MSVRCSKRLNATNLGKLSRQTVPALYNRMSKEIISVHLSVTVASKVWSHVHVCKKLSYSRDSARWGWCWL